MSLFFLHNVFHRSSIITSSFDQILTITDINKNNDTRIQCDSGLKFNDVNSFRNMRCTGLRLNRISSKSNFFIEEMKSSYVCKILGPVVDHWSLNFDKCQVHYMLSFHVQWMDPIGNSCNATLAKVHICKVNGEFWIQQNQNHRCDRMTIKI